MLKSESKVATTSGVVSSAVICKIQNMTWLKRDSTTSTDPKPTKGTGDKMLKAVPHKEKDGQSSSERKDKKNRRKSSKKTNVDHSKNIDSKNTNNVKSTAEKQKKGQSRKSEVLVMPECSLTLTQGKNVWDQSRNAAESLFPNVESMVNSEESEKEMMERAISESLETAFLEKCAVDDIPQEKVVVESAERSEDEDAWGNFRSNLPTPEPEKDLKISDANNNSGLQSIENLTVPSVKLESRRWRNSGAQEDKNYHGGRSELLPCSKSFIVDTPLTPTVDAKFIDKYGRVDGCTEKRLFMGKGARYKEQEYLRQQKLHQLESTNGSNESEGSSQEFACPTQQTENLSKSEASSRDSVQSSNAFEKTSTISVKSTEQPANVSEEISDSSQYPAQFTEQFTSVSEKSPHLEAFIQPVKELTSNLQEISFVNDCALPTSVSQELSGLTEISVDSTNQCTNLSEEKGNYSRRDSDSQMIKTTRTLEQTSVSCNQNSSRVARPILSGANINNQQQMTHIMTSGHSVNRGGYHGGDGNSNKPMRETSGGYDRGSRSEQNSCKPFERSNRDSYRGPRGNRNSNKSYVETSRDSCGKVRIEQNPQQNQRATKHGQSFNKHSGEYNRDVCKGPDQSFHKHNEKQNRNFRGETRTDQNFHKYDRESNREAQRGPRATRNSYKYYEDQNRDLYRWSASEQNRDIHGGSTSVQNRYIDKRPTTEPNRNIHGETTVEENSYKSGEGSIKVLPMDNPKVPPEEPSAQPAEIAVKESQNIIEHPVTQSEAKAFDESNIGATDIPDLSDFKSRYSMPCQEDHPNVSSNYSTPPGFHFPERPTLLPCSNCTPVAPFEVRHANLRMNDPLLYKLLLQKQELTPRLPMKTIPKNSTEMSENTKPHGYCPACNTQLLSNQPGITNPNVDNLEEYQRIFQMWHRLHPLPTNHYIPDMQFPEAMNLQPFDNSEYNTSNMRHSNFPFHENAGFHPSSVNLSNLQPYCPVSHPYPNVPAPMNMHPTGTVYLPSVCENSLEFQRHMPQIMFARQCENATGYQMADGRYDDQMQAQMSKYVQHGHPIPTSFPPKQYMADITAFNRSNVSPENPDVKHKADNQPPHVTAGVCKSIAETEQGFQSAMGAGRVNTYQPIPSVGRRRATLASQPQNN